MSSKTKFKLILSYYFQESLTKRNPLNHVQLKNCQLERKKGSVKQVMVFISTKIGHKVNKSQGLRLDKNQILHITGEKEVKKDHRHLKDQENIHMLINNVMKESEIKLQRKMIVDLQFALTADHTRRKENNINFPLVQISMLSSCPSLLVDINYHNIL